MSPLLALSLLDSWSEFIETNLGLFFPPDRWNDLARLTQLAAESQGTQPEDFVKRVLEQPLNRKDAEILAAHLTIGETYFWREPLTFEILEQKILPELCHKKGEHKRLRIWSAGCSGGEEPYSIAMALRRAIPDWRDWNITLLATDINPKSLQKAYEGTYNQWSFRNAPAWLKTDFFRERKKGVFEILPDLRNQVEFAYLNLVEDLYPSPENNTLAMDIIYCRNVLMYFKPDRFRKVVRALFNCLKEGGYLIVSSSELSIQNFQDFQAVNFPGLVAYQKSSPGNTKQSDWNWKEYLEKLEREAVFLTPVTLGNEESEIAWPAIQVGKSEVTVTEPQSKAIDKAMLCYKSGAYEEVIQVLEEADKGAAEYGLLIRSFANIGKMDEAIKVAEAVLESDRLNTPMYYLYATLLQDVNRREDSKRALKSAMYLDPDFVLPYYSYGAALFRDGNVRGAQKYFRAAAKMLKQQDPSQELPESDGLTVGRLSEIIKVSLETRFTG